MRPQDAVDEHNRLIDFLGTGATRRYLDGFLQSMHEDRGGPVIVDAAGRPSADAFIATEVSRLRVATTYFVDRDMVPVARHAAAGLNMLDRFEHDVWPAEAGFLWLDEPLRHRERRGRVSSLRAVVWSRRAADGHPGTYVTWWNDLDDPQDEVVAEIKASPLGHNFAQLRRDCGRLQLVHTSWIADGMRVGPEIVHPTRTDLARYAAGVDGSVLPPAAAPNTDRFLLALLMLLGQTITDVSEGHVRRTAVNAYRRAGLPHRVTVIALRRRKENARHEGESTVEWCHRWVVGGHWARRQCGPTHPLAQPAPGGGWRCRLYISAYAKNADRTDLPWLITEKVHALVR